MHNYFEVHCCNRRPCYCQTDRYRTRGRHLVQGHGHLHNVSDDPDPGPSVAAGHPHAQRNLDLDRGRGLFLGMEQGVDCHPSPDRVHVLRD